MLMMDPRFVSHLADVPKPLEDGVATFHPIEVGDPSLVEVLLPSSGASLPSDVRFCAHRVDIALSDEHRILVEGPTALSAVLGLVQGIMTYSQCPATRGFGWWLRWQTYGAGSKFWQHKPSRFWLRIRTLDTYVRVPWSSG